MRYVFVHGWGFDRSFWSPLLDILDIAAPRCLDFGYFRDGEADLDLPTEPYVAIGHSAGAAWLMDQELPHCRGLIAINSFARFTRGPDFQPGVASRMIARMRDRLSDHAEAVLADFRTLVGAETHWTGTPHIARLRAGLDRLRDADAREDARRWGSKLAWLSGAHDPLLTPEVAQLSFSGESVGSMIVGGHLLPLEQPHTTAEFIHATAKGWCDA